MAPSKPHKLDLRFIPAFLICCMFLAVLGSGPAVADARADALNECRKRMGPGAIAVKDQSFGETNYICDCGKPYIWNESGTACTKLPPNPTTFGEEDPSPPNDVPDLPPGVDTPTTPPPQDSDDPLAPPKAGDDDPADPPPTADNDRDTPPPAKVKKPRKKLKRVIRKKPRKTKPVKPRRVRGSAATARRYCRGRYGKRLVRVDVKRSKFYCHYRGKKARGPNPRIKWKKFKFRNIR